MRLLCHFIFAILLDCLKRHQENGHGSWLTKLPSLLGTLVLLPIFDTYVIANVRVPFRLAHGEAA